MGQDTEQTTSLHNLRVRTTRLANCVVWLCTDWAVSGQQVNCAWFLDRIGGNICLLRVTNVVVSQPLVPAAFSNNGMMVERDVETPGLLPAMLARLFR
jgi:hypothetical protein